MNKKEQSKDYIHIDGPILIGIESRKLYENVKKLTSSIINKIKF